MRTIILFTFLLTFYTKISIAQVYELTLEQSIEIAKNESSTVLQLLQDAKIAENTLKYNISNYRTNIKLGLSLPRYTETVRQWEDSTGVSFYPVKHLRYSGDLRVTQPLPTNGSVYLETGLSSLNDYNTRLRAANMVTRIGVDQPLHAFYGYNALKASIKQAELEYERSTKSLKREELNLIYRVSNSYYNLLSLQKSTEIAFLDLERQLDAYDISKKKFESGLIKEVEALQMEVDLAEAQNNYEIAVLNEVSATNSFKELIGISLQDSITLKSELFYKPIIVDPERAVELALKNRLEIREQEINIETQELNIKRKKAAGMIQASLDAYFEKNGVSNQEIGVGFPKFFTNSYKDFTNRPATYGVGLNITIPILDWGRNKADVRLSQAQRDKSIIAKEAVEREIETEVRNLVNSLNSNLKRLQLLEKNVTVAEKSFDITLKRFSDGDIDSQSLALERTRLNTAYTNHLRAYINYQLYLADLMRKTFYDFENDIEIK